MDELVPCGLDNSSGGCGRRLAGIGLYVWNRRRRLCQIGRRAGSWIEGNPTVAFKVNLAPAVRIGVFEPDLDRFTSVPRIVSGVAFRQARRNAIEPAERHEGRGEVSAMAAALAGIGAEQKTFDWITGAIELI